MTNHTSTHSTTYFMEKRTGEGTHAKPYTYTKLFQVTPNAAAQDWITEANEASTDGTHYGILGVVDYHG